MNDFAKTHWRNFEILTGLLFELEFHLKKEEIFLTRMVKDGGKDIRITKEYYSQVLKFPKIEIWIEAKLRGKGKNIQMGDIAGSAIIASNSNVTSIYFVTNCFFTAQTIEELLTFKEKTGLQIFLIDGYQYRSLLLEYRSKAIAHFEKLTTEGSHEINFIEALLEVLPEKPQKSVLDNFEINILRGKTLTKNSFLELLNDDQKIEVRKSRVSETVAIGKYLNLNDIKLAPIISDREVMENPTYQLIGEKRKALLSEVLGYIQSNEIVFLTGNAGEGKTFFANHLSRKLYTNDYSVLFTDALNNHVLSYTKEIITALIQVDYFKLLEKDDLVVNYLSDFFSLNKVVAQKIVDLIRQDKFTENISPEICFEVLLRIMEKTRARKQILLIVDNLHTCSNDLLAFLKNLILRLKDIGISTLCLTISSRDERNLYPENQWIKSFESITVSNKFRILTIPPLEKNDIKIYIRALVPGATENLIHLIEKNVFVNPFHIKLFVEYLKSKDILKSTDGKFWLLEDPSVLLDSQHLRINTLDNLVIQLLEIKLRNPQFRNVASLVFFFNNSIDIKLLKEFLASADELSILESGLFNGVYSEDSMTIQFSHDLFYYNLPLVLKREVLALYASQLLDIVKKTDADFKVSRTDAIGKLYEYTGKYNSACDNYLLYAKEKHEFSGFTSLLFYEKAIEMHLLSNESQSILFPDIGNLTAELIFQALTLYDRYNFLSGRKSIKFFQLLQKFSDFDQLSGEQNLKHMYFLGLQSTKQEDFKTAEAFFRRAYETISNTGHFSENLIGNIIGCYGINLKHLGRKDESMEFFETVSRRWDNPHILYQKYSNIAAYYLTVDPGISLKKYEEMARQIAPEKDLHLLIDFAMANFYLRNPDSSFNYLKEAIALSRKQVNLSEEARAENILGLLYWQRSNLNAAEHYFDLALSNGELANNHRWIWRIRTNLAQIAFYTQNTAKSYNTGWAVVDHLHKTKDTLVYEACNKKIQSRRFAALKAIAVVFYRMELYNDLKKLEQMFYFEHFSKYLQDLYAAKGDISFDSKDQNLFQKDYFILG